MEELIEKNMGLVMSIVNSFHPKDQTEREDYLQAGRIGLWKALRKFNPAKGNVLSTYAWNPIRWEIIKEIRSKGGKITPFSLSGNDCINSHEPHTLPKTEMLFWEYLPSNLNTIESHIIYLRLQGYNFKEISSKLDHNRSNIKKMYQSAINKIRETNTINE